MTSQQSANLKSARNLAAVRVGIEPGQTASIPYAKREAYVTALAEIILATPDRFDSQTVNAARSELSDTPDGALADASFSFSEFADEFLNNADDLNPTASLWKTLKWLLPVAGLLALAFYFAPQLGLAFANSKKTTRRK